MWVFPKIGKKPKMDGLFHGKPKLKMDDLVGFPPYFFGSTMFKSCGFLQHPNVFGGMTGLNPKNIPINQTPETPQFRFLVPGCLAALTQPMAKRLKKLFWG